ncbi:MAG TPA: ACP S-malonyltransferase [Clostridia bacterium]|nr:ACP S-malonyltransferase [Clostridia bacterium]
MSKVAFVFPGQGSQYVGMGLAMFEAFPRAHEIFERADAFLGFPLSELCFRGPEEQLRLTTRTQPALLTVSVAIASVVQEKGWEPDYVAGHSLGEYTALVMAGALSFEEALGLVEERSRLMEEAVPAGQGSMAAVLGLGAAEVRKICREACLAGWVEPANYNCPGQVVIAGEITGINKAVEIARDRGAKRIIPLAVSGPFHSRLMEPAGKKFTLHLQQVNFQKTRIPVVSNLTALFVSQKAEIIASLEGQLNNPVRWEESINYLISHGTSIFLEVGPGKVLSGLIKKIDRNVLTLNVEDPESLEMMTRSLKEVR